MSHTRRSWNAATPEVIAERGRATRPALSTPNGEQTWYQIKNALDEGGSPVATITLYGDIGSWGITAASFVEELKSIDAPEIRLHVSSPGGEVFDGLAVYNALRSHRAKVIVQVDSLAASIASVIAMAGDRIIMAPHSQLMIHMAAGVCAGEAAELREYADFLDRQSENIAGVYAERAGGTVKHWLKAMAAETWYFADEAVEAGLADEVCKPKRQMDEPDLDDRATAAAWDLSVYNYAHTSREEAPAPPLDAASPSHDTAIREGEWDKGTQVGRLPSPMSVATARKVYATYDSDRVEDGKLPKDAGHLPHHFVSADGSPGAASINGVRAALSSLPKTQGLSEAERSAAETHLRNHLDRYQRENSGSDNHDDTAPVAFDPAAFRAAAVAALDPMPDYQPDHLRSLVAGLAGDAPAPPAPPRAEAPYVPPPADTAPAVDPEQVAVGWFRSLFTAVAHDAPAAPEPARPAPAMAAPPTVYVPEPPAPANEVAVDYMRTLLANAAQDLAAPEQAAAPDPAPAEPVPSIDQTAFERSLREARL